MAAEKEDIEEYLARIRRTVEQANNLVSQAELRMAETDRMLERQGLTREQVMAMRFTEAQLDAANEELKRRGMDPLEKWSDIESYEDITRAEASASLRDADYADDEASQRQKKFGMMMKPFHI